MSTSSPNAAEVNPNVPNHATAAQSQLQDIDSSSASPASCHRCQTVRSAHGTTAWETSTSTTHPQSVLVGMRYEQPLSLNLNPWLVQNALGGVKAHSRPHWPPLSEGGGPEGGGVLYQKRKPVK